MKRKKLIVIGSGGTIGTEVAMYLSTRHDVVTAGRSSGNLTVDIEDAESIENIFEEEKEVDGVVCIAGEAKWADFSELTEEDYYIGFRSKLMGQVNLTRIASKHMNEGGSITLTTGILAEDPVVKTASAAMVNGAIHSFVKAVALELNKGMRINAVAAGLVEKSEEKYREYFPGHNPVPMKRVVKGYIRSVEGRGNGEIIRIYG
ncbi:MAG: short chain dehydrogenase [Pyrinomonadaceae bacterium]|nr:short chain dehydrogenase [Pyrinomonadaceae bacterium]